MSYQTTNPKGAKALLDGAEGYAYVDVRTEEEFAQGHPPGAYNVPVALRGARGMELNPGFLAAMERAFEKGDPLVIGCAAGGRSAHACDLLAMAGFGRLVNMDGGYQGAPAPGGGIREPGWVACGLPTTTETEPGRAWRDLGG